MSDIIDLPQPERQYKKERPYPMSSTPSTQHKMCPVKTCHIAIPRARVACQRHYFDLPAETRLAFTEAEHRGDKEAIEKLVKETFG